MASATDAGAAEAPAAGPAVAIDQSYDDQTDSAYDSELASYTTSLASGVTDYKQENGRRYHAFREGAYAFPNDEKEMDRLDMAHKMIETAMGGKLHSAPLENPQRILDVGTGTGIWSMEIGDKFEHCEVIGNDLSPIQPRWVPPNVRFEVDDIEADWTYSGKFDFVHCRCMYSSIKNWPRLVKQTFENLQPGGYAEFTDCDLKWRSPDNTVAGTTAEKVNNIFLDTCNAAGLDPCPGKSQEKWVRDAGFEDVHATNMIVPFGTWAADKKLKEIGAWNYLQTMEGLESFFMAVFTRMLNYHKEEVDVMCAQVRANLKDSKFHAYFVLYNTWGRKPGSTAKDDPEGQAATTATTASKAPATSASGAAETTPAAEGSTAAGTKSATAKESAPAPS